MELKSSRPDKDRHAAIMRYLRHERQRIVDSEFQAACNAYDVPRVVARLQQLAIEGADKTDLAMGIESNDSATLDRVIAPVILAVIQKFIDV